MATLLIFFLTALGTFNGCTGDLVAFLNTTSLEFCGWISLVAVKDTSGKDKYNTGMETGLQCS